MKKIITIILIFILSFTSVNSLKIFEIEETEKLSLDLKTDDPDEDILTYSYTGPLNEYGEWQTTYGDAGEYSATITVYVVLVLELGTILAGHDSCRGYNNC